MTKQQSLENKTTESNIYSKINLIMQDVQYLQKDDQVSFGNTRYKAISEEKVTTAIRESMVKRKVVIIPVEQEHFKQDSLTTVNVKYKIVDCDSGDYIIAVSSGTGADTQDKGVGKAMTYAYKYLLLRTFAIPTGEDPDKISSEQLDANDKARKNFNQKKQEENAVDPSLVLINEINALLNVKSSQGVDLMQLHKECQSATKDFKNLKELSLDELKTVKSIVISKK
jgi:hypothetical protein